MRQIFKKSNLLKGLSMALFASFVFVACTDTPEPEEEMTEPEVVSPMVTEPTDSLPPEDSSATQRPDPIRTTPTENRRTN